MKVMNHITDIFLLLLLLFAVVAAFFVLIMFIYMIVAKLKMIKDGRRKKLTSITLQKITPRDQSEPFLRLSFPDRTYDYYRTLVFSTELDDYVYEYRSVNGTLCPLDYYENSHTGERVDVRDNDGKTLNERLEEMRAAECEYPLSGCARCLELVKQNLRGRISEQAFEQGVNKMLGELDKGK